MRTIIVNVYYLNVRVKYFFQFFLSAHFLIQISAQSGIQIGEKCPDVSINQIINYKASSVKLSDFKGKPLILDFWSSYCSACLQSFIKTDSLVKEFGDQVQVLLVTFQDERTVRNVFKNIKRLNNIKLPSVINDSVLRFLFPYMGLPHVVWIDKDGIVRAISNGGSVNRNNIAAFTKGEPLNLPLKWDDQSFNMGDNIAALNIIENRDKILKYSYLSDERADLPTGKTLLVRDKNEIKIQSVNNKMYDLYLIAYGKSGSSQFGYNRVYKVFDNELKGVTEDVYEKTSKFCYDLQIKDTSWSHALNIMQNDLDRYNDWNSSLEKRKITCGIIKLTSDVDRLKSKSRGKPSSYIDNGKYFAFNVPLEIVINNRFNGPAGRFPIPVINESGFKGKVDIQLPARISDVQKVNEAMAPYGLEMVLQEREIEVLILREK